MRWFPRLAAAALPFLSSCAASPEPSWFERIPLEVGQVLISTTRGWSSADASLRRFERTPAGWRQVGRAIPATVGRHGLGWGIGLHSIPGGGPRKREGDGKAPAGIFRLGPAFGYSRSRPDGCALPYRVATERDYFVDDPSSPDYNRWKTIAPREPNDPGRRWRSFERMRRDDGLYEFGITVEHNMPDAEPASGSAIFLHVWSGPGRPTAGCTAMAREDLLDLLRWLRPGAWLVQVPEEWLDATRPLETRTGGAGPPEPRGAADG
ncbi:MAG: L,D-transpeptidase family protein [Planctomycetota bacterium]